MGILARITSSEHLSALNCNFLTLKSDLFADTVRCFSSDTNHFVGDSLVVCNLCYLETKQAWFSSEFGKMCNFRTISIAAIELAEVNLNLARYPLTSRMWLKSVESEEKHIQWILEVLNQNQISGFQASTIRLAIYEYLCPRILSRRYPPQKSDLQPVFTDNTIDWTKLSAEYRLIASNYARLIGNALEIDTTEVGKALRSDYSQELQRIENN